MGQAKNRGTKEDRIAQATAATMPPKVGLYVSKTNINMRLIVEEVTVLDDDEDEEDKGFFLVHLVNEADAGEPDAIYEEYIPDEWAALVRTYGLVYMPS